MVQEIIIREVQTPSKANTRLDIKWIGESFGLTDGRDTERMSEQILQEVIYAFAKKGCVSTEQIAEDLGIDVQRANYHLRSLIANGLVYREKRLIFLRQGSMKAAVEEIRRDANRIFDRMSEIAAEVDSGLSMKNR